MSKRPRDNRREAAVMMQVGDASDMSPIAEMIPLTGRRIIVKERGIWQSQLADNVDPQRTNPAIPNTQQKLMMRGAADALVGRILLQAKRLLKQSMLPGTIDTAVGMEITLAFLQDMDVLCGKAEEFRSTTDRLNDAFNAARPSGNTLQVPAVGDVAARGKAFIQAADHAVGRLWRLARNFHPDLPVGVSWQKFKDRMLAGSEEQKALDPLLGELANIFAFLRNTPNAVEHEKPGQKVIFKDYQLRDDGKVHAPSIEVIEKSTPLSETDLTGFFESTVGILIDAYEALLINLCSLHVSDGAFAAEVIELPPDERRYPHVKYAYALMLGDRLVPYAD